MIERDNNDIYAPFFWYASAVSDIYDGGKNPSGTENDLLSFINYETGLEVTNDYQSYANYRLRIKSLDAGLAIPTNTIDVNFESLQLGNGDGTADAGEVFTLTDKGITAIQLNTIAAAQLNAGNFLFV